MAKTHRYPIIIWQDHGGMFTARLLDDDSDGVAVGRTRKSVVDQLKEYLRHMHRRSGYVLSSDFVQPTLRKVKLTVYPEYQEKKRTYACREAVRLNLPCVTGERQTGLFVAMLPTIGVGFDFHDKATFSKLASHYVRSELKGKTPRQVSRFLPPANEELDEIVVTLKEDSYRPRNDEDVENLAKIADHIGTRDFRRISRTWERETEVQRLERLLGEESTSVVLVGEPGSGKTSVLIEAAKNVELRRKPKSTGSQRLRMFWMTSAGRIISGMRYIGQWEERLEEAIEELSNLGGVLCIENLLELLRVGGSGPESSVASFLLPFLQNNELRIVVEATAQELEACNRLLPGIVDRLQVVKLGEFDEVSSMRLMGRAAEFFAQQEKVTFPAEAVDAIYQLFRRFLPYAAFPGKVIDFMTELAGEAHDLKLDDVDADTVRGQFGQATGLPEMILRDDLPLRESDVVDVLGRQVLGQPEPVQQIAKMLVRFKAGLNDPQRPLGVFLFCGPTGVGKTALVRALGDYLFGQKPESERLVRLDMSEYAGYDASARLLGSAHGSPSDLIRRVRSNPFTVVLLDEIEKAADEVFDVLLNVFEEGRLTDAFGRVTSFHSTIIIMTSNLGAGGSGAMGFGAGSEMVQAAVDTTKVKKFFRPEFFNRLDQVVYFEPLDEGTIKEVTRKELAEIGEREGLSERKLTLTFSEEIVECVAKEGFDPKFGARPLQRKIEEAVTAPLARYLVENAEVRNVEISVCLEDGGVVFG